ncbi:MAG: hypothetical protein CMK32_01865 [Porticoccaceae bacterium]|nr:hypothetical protein [Porticoccaceae bacterium]
MIVLRLLGRNCPEPAPARRSASRQGSITATGRKRAEHAQPLTARTPWYGEGNSKTATPHQPQHQGLASGARRPSRAGGVKDQSRMAAIRQEARGAAREPDGGTPGRIDCLSLATIYR